MDCHGHSANIKTYKAKIGNWDKKNGCASKLRDLKPISWLLWNAPLLQKHCKARTIWVWQKCASHLSQDGTISTRHATINTNRHSCDHLARFSSARTLGSIAHLLTTQLFQRSWLFRSIFQWMGNWWLLPVLYCSRIFIHLRHSSKLEVIITCFTSKCRASNSYVKKYGSRVIEQRIEVKDGMSLSRADHFLYGTTGTLFSLVCMELRYFSLYV